MTGSGLPLRSYQEWILERVRGALSGAPRGTGAGPVNRVAVAAATGAGKTVMFSHLLTDSRWTPDVDPAARRLIIVHRDELVQQARKTLYDVDPGLRRDGGIGVVKADQDDHGAHIVIGSVQTLANPARRQRVRDVGLLVVDEAHHAVAETWRDVLGHYGAWEGVPTIGWSATLDRADDGCLGDIWEEVPAEWTIEDGVRCGALLRPEGLQIELAQLDTSRLPTTAGELRAGALGAALEKADAPTEVAKAYDEYARTAAGGIRPGVVFAPSVSVAELTAEALNERGIPAEVIQGNTPVAERGEIYERFRTGRTKVLSNCMVLTEGWDAPWAEVAVIMRATRSNPLYIQMVGRILRPWAGKGGALVLDVVGATADNKLMTLVNLQRTITDKESDDPLPGDDERDDGPGLSEDGPIARDPRLYEMRAREIALMEQSKALWLRTPKGVMFVPAGDTIFFAWPTGPGTFSLGAVRSVPCRTKPEMFGDLTDLPLEYAVAHLERIAIDYDPTVARRNASWRGLRGGLVTEKQQAYARGLGLDIPNGTLKGDASDMISIRIAERALGG